SIESPLTESGEVTYVNIAEQLSILNLSVYTPSDYILPNKVQRYADLYDRRVKSGKLAQVDRERSLRLLMRINLLKRLESSVDSFRITLEGMISQIEKALDAIEKGNTKEYLTEVYGLGNEEVDWEPEWGDEENVIGKRVKVRIEDMDALRWREDLSVDLETLSELHSRVANIRGENDLKLKKLKKLLTDKINNPTNPGNRKVIIFTAFADTANYLYDEIQVFVKKNFGLNTALITGSKRACSAQSIPTELNPLLTCFSPLSKDKALIYPHITEKIDILIATDSISEGQNLQDCDFLVNYDIHWNPVRIIQRCGRIDRIGSPNERITLVNFWPEVTLDAYINLK